MEGEVTPEPPAADDRLDYARAEEIEVTIEGDPVPEGVEYAGRYIPAIPATSEDDSGAAPIAIRWHN